MINGKNILLGISGSIAAYKTPYIVRELVKYDCNVKVILTKDATNFVSELTLSVLTKNEVNIEMVNDDKSWNSHVKLAEWADVFLIAPASSKTLSNLANGKCENLLIATFLSYNSFVFIAPAMDAEMNEHVTTNNNIKTLVSQGNFIIDSEFGELASGLSGFGRLSEPKKIIDYVIKTLSSDLPLSGTVSLVTAGPTRESIDSVRYLSNRSTGLMGLSIAKELARNGSEVNLILGPSSYKINYPNVNLISVESCDEMYIEAHKFFSKSDICIFSAAVSDYKISNKFSKKIKKSDFINLELEKNIDIAKELCKNKKEEQFCVGFALEDDNNIKNAQKKLKEKNFNFIVLNSLENKDTCFESFKNKITIIDNHNTINFDLKSKKLVAKDIVNHIIKTK